MSSHLWQCHPSVCCTHPVHNWPLNLNLYFTRETGREQLSNLIKATASKLAGTGLECQISLESILFPVLQILWNLQLLLQHTSSFFLYHFLPPTSCTVGNKYRSTRNFPVRVEVTWSIKNPSLVIFKNCFRPQSPWEMHIHFCILHRSHKFHHSPISTTICQKRS